MENMHIIFLECTNLLIINPTMGKTIYCVVKEECRNIGMESIIHNFYISVHFLDLGNLCTHSPLHLQTEHIFIPFSCLVQLHEQSCGSFRDMGSLVIHTGDQI